MTQTIDARKLTHIDRIDFLRGWQSVKGYVGDIDTAQPWCKPWTWDDPIITVDGVTPEQWGASHCERHRRDVEDDWNRRAKDDDYRRYVYPRTITGAAMDAQPDDDSEKLTIFDRLKPYDGLQWLSNFADVYELIYDRTVMTFSVNLTYKSDDRFVTRIVQEPVNGCGWQLIFEFLNDAEEVTWGIRWDNRSQLDDAIAKSMHFLLTLEFGKSEKPTDSMIWWSRDFWSLRSILLVPEAINDDEPFGLRHSQTIELVCLAMQDVLTLFDEADLPTWNCRHP